MDGTAGVEAPNPFASLAGETAKHGGVTFKFRKFPAYQGFQIFERIRPLLGSTLATIRTDEPMEVMIGKLLVGLPEGALQQVANMVFPRVYFRDANRSEFVGLHGAEDEAFKDLEAIHVYLVVAQAVLVNFRGSFGVLRSLAPDPAPATE